MLGIDKLRSSAVDRVVENTGFELMISEELRENEPPSLGELRLLRREVDPEGIDF